MKETSDKILVVEDEPEMAEGLRYNLELEGYQVQVAGDGEKGLELARSWTPDLTLLDLMLPKMSGLQVLQAIRQDKNWNPILILTAKNQEEDIVAGLEAGADDYVCKPFGLAELLARIRAILRRKQQGTVANEETLTLGADTEIDFRKYEIRRAGIVSPLSRFEAEILRFLLARRGEVVSREELLRSVWGYTILPQTRTVDNHMARIRKKIEAHPDEPLWIQTVHGVGYRFNVEPEATL